MKRFGKLLGVALALALMASLCFSSIVLADDPIVSIDATSPGNGNITVTTSGIDSSAWHPGSVGEVNTFHAVGSFTVSYDSYTGNYGALSTYVNASSTNGATFTMSDTQYFDILSANHNYNTVGTFTATAGGVTADMNLKSIGSMYCWSEATNPWSASALQGTYIAKQYDMSTNSVLTATVTVSATATGGASISNSNIWGWGANENGTITTNYSSGTRSLTASGSGIYQQYVSSSTSLTSNISLNADGTPVVVSAAMPGGAMNIISNFVNSFTANPYSVTAQ